MNLINRLFVALPDKVIQELRPELEHRTITNVQLAHFLAQCDHESAGFKVKEENLNYSAERLIQIFPNYFDKSTAKQYERNPQKIANRVYGNRMGNSNQLSGDGYKYRGRGYIQLTGKSNYQLFDKTCDDDILSNPDLVATKYPLRSALWFFDANRLWDLCDKPTEQAVKNVTRRINGGLNGIDDRLKKFNKYWGLLK